MQYRHRSFPTSSLSPLILSSLTRLRTLTRIVTQTKNDASTMRRSREATSSPAKVATIAMGVALSSRSDAPFCDYAAQLPFHLATGYLELRMRISPEYANLALPVLHCFQCQSRHPNQLFSRPISSLRDSHGEQRRLSLQHSLLARAESGMTSASADRCQPAAESWSSDVVENSVASIDLNTQGDFKRSNPFHPGFSHAKNQLFSFYEAELPDSACLVGECHEAEDGGRAASDKLPAKGSHSRYLLGILNNVEKYLADFSRQCIGEPAVYRKDMEEIKRLSKNKITWRKLLLIGGAARLWKAKSIYGFGSWMISMEHSLRPTQQRRAWDSPDGQRCLADLLITVLADNPAIFDSAIGAQSSIDAPARTKRLKGSGYRKASPAPKSTLRGISLAHILEAKNINADGERIVALPEQAPGAPSNVLTADASENTVMESEESILQRIDAKPQKAARCKANSDVLAGLSRPVAETDGTGNTIGVVIVAGANPTRAEAEAPRDESATTATQTHDGVHELPFERLEARDFAITDAVAKARAGADRVFASLVDAQGKVAHLQQICSRTPAAEEREKEGMIAAQELSNAWNDREIVRSAQGALIQKLEEMTKATNIVAQVLGDVRADREATAAAATDVQAYAARAKTAIDEAIGSRRAAAEELETAKKAAAEAQASRDTAATSAMDAHAHETRAKTAREEA
ncbi:hypothetical protein K523DRAFT_334150, partial [Schizophyllum commune Tattone D]